MQTRPGLGTSMTGDVTQTRATAVALEKLGVNVCFSDSLEPDVSRIDVVHLFSTLIPNYTYLRLKYLKEKNVPVVVSTIYWEWEAEELKRESIQGLGITNHYASMIRSLIGNRLPYRLRYQLGKSKLPYEFQRQFYKVEKYISLRQMRKYIYENANVLLPNSHMEYSYLEGKFGIRNDYVVVPNAVDPGFAEGDAKAFYNKYGLRDFVLCVAVVQIRKNQLRLIRAMRDLDVPLVLIGHQESRYTNICRREASSNIHLLGELRGEDLKNAYAAAKVHALVSFYETPGLSSLEAAISDTVLVVTDRGCTREYFKDQAFYCDPNSEKSIREAIQKSLISKSNNVLKQRVLFEYNWEKAAKMTLEGYKRAMFNI